MILQKDALMKKLILFTTFVFVALMLQAQKKDVTRFLGIPVDGTKSEMIQKLKDKGYVYNPESELLEGEFNGRDVYIGIVTNNRKVWRIWVRDAHRVNETQIRIRFNNLLQQFNNNKKYYSWPDSVILKYTIPKKLSLFHTQNNCFIKIIQSNFYAYVDKFI